MFLNLTVISKTDLVMKKLFLILFIALATACSESASSPDIASSPSGGSSTGTGGSLARFTILNDYLYIATSNTIYSFDISDLTQPILRSEIQLWNFAETIFSLDGKLLLGTTSGVMIYTVDNPAQPQYMSTFWHVTSCDPVVARGDWAFSTLRIESSCNRGDNRLDIIDISNLNSPQLRRSINMSNPKGLGISGDYLYVCDNQQLKTFNIASPENTTFAMATKNLAGCYDVIPVNDLLIVATTNGIVQYRVGSDGSLTYLSTISI